MSMKVPLSPALEEAAKTGIQWLADKVKVMIEYAHHDDIFMHAAAMGMLAKHGPISGDPYRIIHKLRVGLCPPELDKERAWARSLSEKVLEKLDRLANAQAQGILADLVILGIDPISGSSCISMGTGDPTESVDWRVRLAEICESREKLDGVRILLEEANSGSRMAVGIAVLDDGMKELLQKTFNFCMLPTEEFHRSDLLVSAGIVSPGNWWSMYAELWCGHLATFEDRKDGKLTWETIFYCMDEVCPRELSRDAYFVSEFTGTLMEMKARCEEQNREIRTSRQIQERIKKGA